MTKEEKKLYMRVYYEKHKEQYKKYYEEHNEERKLYQKSFRKNHKDYVNKAQNDRNARTTYAPKHHSKWTSNEEQYLKTNAPYKTAYEIAITLGRSEDAVSNKACILGVSLNKYNKRIY